MGCQHVNWTPKTKCSQCGLKKTWAQVVAGWGGRPAQSGSSPPQALLQPTQPTPPLPASPAEKPPEPFDRRNVSEEIRGLETAIANLGGQADLRAPLQARIESLKLSVVRSKPLCVQLEECRKLVQRRQARRDQAHESVRQATLALEKADSELQAAHFELKALQEEFAHRESPQQRESPANSMQALTAALTQVISDMRGGGVIPDQLIQQTEQHMKQLMNGVTAIATAVAEQPGNAAAAPAAGAASEAYKRVGPSEEEDEPSLAHRRCLRKTAGGESVAVPPEAPARTEADALYMEIFRPPATHHQQG